MLRAQSYHVVGTAIAAVLGVALTPKALSQAAPTRPNVPYRTIAVTGQPLPGEAAGTFRFFDSPARASETGQVVFLGRPANSSGPNLYVSSAGEPVALTPVARLGQPAPGLGQDVTFRGIDPNDYRANPAGQVVFGATVQGPGIVEFANNKTIWVYSAGAPQLVSQVSVTPIAGTDFRVALADQSVIDDAGNVTFRGGVMGPGVTQDTAYALLHSQAGQFTLLARQGDVAPGTGGLRYSSAFGAPAMSGSGNIAFVSPLDSADRTQLLGNGIFSGTPGSVQAVAYPGSTAPGTGLRFSNVSSSLRDVNDQGAVMFEGYLAVESGPNGAIYAGQPGAVRLVAREGAAAPGLTGSTVGRAFGVALNDRGDYTFGSAIHTAGKADGQAIYTGTVGGAAGGTPGLVAASGQRAVGTEAGLLFTQFGQPDVNADGQVAFFADLAGMNLSAGADRGIFATDPSGVLRLVVREGDLFPVAPGDLRRIESFATSDFNGLRFEGPELAFHAEFTDGSSGVFTALVVPEPSVLAAGLFPALLLFRRRRA